MSTPELDIANAMIEGIENNFKGKTNEELKELIQQSMVSVMMSFMLQGDNGGELLILTLSNCVKLACGATESEIKKNAVVNLFGDGPIGNMIKDNPEMFFSNADNDTSEVLNAIASQMKSIIGNSLYELMFAIAYVEEPASQEIIDKIKKLYVDNNSENVLDDLFGSGMLVADDNSATRKTSGKKTKSGPKDANWSSIVLDDGTLEITGYKGQETTLIIPSEIGGKNVSSLGGYCLSPNKERLKNHQKKVYNKIKKIVVSAGIKSIDGYAFESCNNLEEIEFNEGLESIGTRILNCCEKIKEVVVPNTVSFIGEDAFCCGSLEKLTMPENPVQTMGTVSSYNSISEPVFSGDMTKLYCYPLKSKLKEYFIPDTVKYISSSAFNGLSGCDGLEVVHVPNGVEYIGSFTFPSSVKDIYLPDSINDMDFAAFGFGEEDKPLLHTNNPYVIEFAKENDFKTTNK